MPYSCGGFHGFRGQTRRVYISSEVHDEVVVAGAGLPRAAEVSEAGWIEVKAVENPAGLRAAQRQYGLGSGEMSAIMLAKEIDASAVPLDDYRARKLAKTEKLGFLRSVGLLEALYSQDHFDRSPGHLSATAGARGVTSTSVCWTRRLRALGLPPL